MPTFDFDPRVVAGDGFAHKSFIKALLKLKKDKGYCDTVFYQQIKLLSRKVSGFTTYYLVCMVTDHDYCSLVEGVYNDLNSPCLATQENEELCKTSLLLSSNHTMVCNLFPNPVSGYHPICDYSRLVNHPKEFDDPSTIWVSYNILVENKTPLGHSVYFMFA